MYAATDAGTSASIASPRRTRSRTSRAEMGTSGTSRTRETSADAGAEIPGRVSTTTLASPGIAAASCHDSSSCAASAPTSKHNRSVECRTHSVRSDSTVYDTPPRSISVSSTRNWWLCSPQHGHPVSRGSGVPARLERLRVGGHEVHDVGIQRVARGCRHDQVPIVNRIERAAENRAQHLSRALSLRPWHTPPRQRRRSDSTAGGSCTCRTARRRSRAGHRLPRAGRPPSGHTSTGRTAPRRP